MLNWLLDFRKYDGIRIHERESISILKDFIFNDLKLDRIEAACLPRNMRSLRTLLKSEFEIEGHAKKYLKINGAWEDHILLSCIKHESI